MPLIPASQNGKDFQPDCSVIIPVYNGLEYTSNCIRKLLDDESAATFELIVVDNGSTDGVEHYLRSLQDKLTLITTGQNIGFARANNLAAGRACGRYLILLNSDTIPEPGWLDAMVRAAESDDDIAIIGARLLYPENRLIQHAGVAFTDDLKLLHLYEGFPEDHPAVNRRRDFRTVTAACMLVKSDRYHQLNGFDERFVNGFEDVDFCLRAGEQGWRVVYEPEAVLLHHAEASPERHQFEEDNSILLTKLWRHKLTPDLNRYLAEDGFQLEDSNGSSRIVSQGVDLNKLFGQARAVLKDGRPGEALERYLEIYRLAPVEATALRYLAEIYERRGELDRAAMMLLRLSRLQPEAEVLMKLADNALKRKDYDRVKPIAQKAFELAAPDSDLRLEALAIMGDGAFKCGTPDTAAGHYEQALAEDPFHLRALIGLGTVTLSREDCRGALELFERALAVNPHHGRAILGKGLACVGLSRRQEAADLITQAFTIDPDNSWALASVLPLLSEQRRLDQADLLLENYIKRYPDDPPMLLARAGIAYALGNYNLSRKLLDQVIADNPDYPGAVDLDRELRRSQQQPSLVAEPIPV